MLHRKHRLLGLFHVTWKSQPPSHPPAKAPHAALIDAVLARAAPLTAPAQVRRDMRAMMRRFRIDPAHIPRPFTREMKQAKRLCAQCTAIGRCQHHLYDGTSDQPQGFCPNARLWERLAAEQDAPRA